jgi:hypothetical protein
MTDMFTLSAAIDPSVHTPEDSEAPSPSLFFDSNSGWIVWNAEGQGEELQLCWLPLDLRGFKVASHESMFVVASKFTQQLTIIDFSPMLNRLRKLRFTL